MSKKVDAMMNRKVNLRQPKQPSTYLDVAEKLVLELATEIHRARSSDVAISWTAQEEAQDFYNEHGLVATLDKMLELCQQSDTVHRR